MNTDGLSVYKDVVKIDYKHEAVNHLEHGMYVVLHTQDNRRLLVFIETWYNRHLPLRFSKHLHKVL